MPRDPLLFAYKLVCTFPECPGGPGEKTVWNSASAGWRTGDLVPIDPSDFDIGKCPNCGRHIMRVTNAPPPVPPGNPPEGFWKIPES